MSANILRSSLSKSRHQFRFDKEEIEACVISVLILAFIVSFNKWGEGDAFDFGVGLINLFQAVIILSLILGFQLITTKLMALHWGYRAEFKIWWYGILIGLVLAFLSASFTSSLGKTTVIWFLAPGGVFFHHLAARRLGWFRYGVNMKETGICCMLGSFSIIFLAIIFKILLYISPENLFFYEAMNISLWFALFSMLPIPPLNGLRVFFYSRVVYAFIFGIFIGFSILLRTNLNIFVTILLSLILGVIIWVLNLWKGEPHWA